MNAEGALHVSTALGELTDDAPFIYQEINGQQTPVAGRFELVDADTYTFTITGIYDATRELVIDPDLAWGSFLGGTNTRGCSVSVSPSGEIWLAGYTQGVSISVPTPGGFDSTRDGESDVFVMRIASSGQLLWGSFLGGSDWETGYQGDLEAPDISVDSQGNAFVVGCTGSADFPAFDSFDSTYNGPTTNGRDGFLAKITSSGQLDWATYLGGEQYDGAIGVAVDSHDNALVVGHTLSDDFPAQGGFDSQRNGGFDGFVTKVASDGQLVWSTFLGGSLEDNATAVAVDGHDNVLVAGSTRSENFPTGGGFDRILGGGYWGFDGFVVKLSPTGQFGWGSFLGGNCDDGALGIACDAGGNALVTGYTWSEDFPTTGGFETVLDKGRWEGVHRAVGRDRTPSSPRSARHASWCGLLTWEGAKAERGNAIAVNSTGDAIVTGVTKSADFPAVGGFDSRLDGAYDAFVAAVSSTCQFLWGSFLGGSSADYGYGVAVDAAGDVFVTGNTLSADFPTPGGFQGVYSGSSDGFAVKISDDEIYRDVGDVIIDGPWVTLPTGVGSGVSLDKESDSLTLQSNPASLAFLLQPDADENAYTNSVYDMQSYDGRLYLGYGDLLNNRGPVDILYYDPQTGEVIHEMEDVPEEQIGGWSVGSDRAAVCRRPGRPGKLGLRQLLRPNRRGLGEAAHDPRGLHVGEMVDFQGRLYAAYSSDGATPLPHPSVLVSDNGGASWLYEQIDQETFLDSSIVELVAVTHASGECLYARMWVQPPGSEYGESRLYRLAAGAWQRVNLASAPNDFQPQSLFAFGDKLLVAGNLYDASAQEYPSVVYALDGQTQTEWSFLRDRQGIFSMLAEQDGWLYAILTEPEFWQDPVRDYTLYRTRDGQTWETLGPLTLPAGAQARVAWFLARSAVRRCLGLWLVG